MKMLEDNGRMYGYEITKAVKERSNNKLNITEAALYPALHKLEAEELLETTTEMIDGRVRKYYALTKKGKKETKLKLDAFRAAMESVQEVLNLKLSNG